MKDMLHHTIEEAWDDQVAMMQDIVRIPSITGSEERVQQYMASAMAAQHLDVDAWCPTFDELSGHPAFSDDGLPLGDRPVVVGRWPGNGEGKSIILNGHMDVVPVGDLSIWSYPPWDAVIAEGRLHGRGSCDMKSNVVAALFAIRALMKVGFKPGGDILLQSVIGEETGGVGTLATIQRGYRADAVIIMEPTELTLSPVCSGALSFRLTVPGLAAHGGLREEGVSAVTCFIPLYNALKQLEKDRDQSFQHPLFLDDRLAAPLSIGVVKSGDWVSTVPEELVAEGRYGVFPGETIDTARKQFEEVILHAAKDHPWLSKNPPTVTWFEGQFEPGETSGEAPIVDTLSLIHNQVTGRTPKVAGVPWGSDLRFFTNYAQIAGILYGAGNVRLAHTVKESIPLDEVKLLTEVLANTIMEWCK